MIHIELTSSAKDSVLVANTPSFLLRKLQQDAAVQNVIETFSSVEVLDFLKDCMKRNPSSPEELTERYVALVAFGVMSAKEEWQRMSSFPLENLPWGREMTVLLESTRNDSFTTVDTSIVSPASDVSAQSTETWEQQGEPALSVKEAA